MLVLEQLLEPAQPVALCDVFVLYGRSRCLPRKVRRDGAARYPMWAIFVASLPCMVVQGVVLDMATSIHSSWHCILPYPSRLR